MISASLRPLYTMTLVFDAIVIGGGQAGLAAGYYLQQAGLDFTILEAEPQPKGSWPHYYRSLRLFSTAGNSALPGLPFGGDPQRYPTRDEVMAYLTHYAEHWKLPVVTNTRVAAVTRSHTCFTVTAEDHRLFHSRSLIAATGSFHRPYQPQLPGQTRFGGTILHAAAYRTPEAFRGQRVIVVGAGNSAVQIAVEVAQVARVTLATRSSIRFTPQRMLGRDLFSLVALTGIERLPLGQWRRLQEPRVVIDAGAYKRAIAQGLPDRQPMFQSFTPNGVIWSDGRTEMVDAVIFATGYRPNLAYLVPLAALDATGTPVQRAGISLATPGLYYVGLTGQRTFVSATLRGVGPDAAYVVRHLRQYLQRIPVHSEA